MNDLPAVALPYLLLDDSSILAKDIYTIPYIFPLFSKKK